MTTQFIKDMDIVEYHNKKDYLSKTMLKDLADCPAIFKYKYHDGGKTPPTKSLRLGSAVHTLALEPELWKAGYHVMPETYFNDKGEEKSLRHDIRMQAVQDQYFAAGYDVFKDESQNWQVLETKKSKVILTKKEFEQIESMANALIKDRTACALLSGAGYVESSIFWEKEHTENESGKKMLINKRTRPDLLRNDGVIVDLKTAASVKPDMFFKSSSDLCYDLSVALAFEGYNELHGKDPDNYVFVCVESTAPFLISIFESTKPMDDTMVQTSFLEYGQAHLESLIQLYMNCTLTNKWRGYQESIGTMSVPPWALNNFIQKGF